MFGQNIKVPRLDNTLKFGTRPALPKPLSPVKEESTAQPEGVGENSPNRVVMDDEEMGNLATSQTINDTNSGSSSWE